MTLILAHVAPYGVIHVSDRLLTERGTARPFEAFSNKALLYLCADAIVAIGYTGLAYIGDFPADVWIANQLVGKQLQEHTEFGQQMHIEPRNIVSAVEMLRSRIESEMRPTRMPEFGLLITGWKWTPKEEAQTSRTVRRSGTVGWRSHDYGDASTRLVVCAWSRRSSRMYSCFKHASRSR